MIAPGSRVAHLYLERAGLLTDGGTLVYGLAVLRSRVAHLYPDCPALRGRSFGLFRDWHRRRLCRRCARRAP